MRYRTFCLLPLAAALLAGCASIPQPLEGDFEPVSWDAAHAGAADGRRVRWGGTLIETEPDPEQTCFFILAQPLDKQARPEPDADSPGRFVACEPGFHDPEIFRKGRELTVTGTLDGSVQRKVGTFDYSYPRVAADAVYLWPRRPAYAAAPPAPWGSYWDPYWSPGWIGWGPAWYPPPVIVVPRHPVPRPPPARK